MALFTPHIHEAIALARIHAYDQTVFWCSSHETEMFPKRNRILDLALSCIYVHVLLIMSLVSVVCEVSDQPSVWPSNHWHVPVYEEGGRHGRRDGGVTGRGKKWEKERREGRRTSCQYIAIEFLQCSRHLKGRVNFQKAQRLQADNTAHQNITAVRGRGT